MAGRPPREWALTARRRGSLPAIHQQKMGCQSLPKQFDRLTAAKHSKKPTGIFGKSLGRPYISWVQDTVL